MITRAPPVVQSCIDSLRACLYVSFNKRHTRTAVKKSTLSCLKISRETMHQTLCTVGSTKRLDVRYSSRSTTRIGVPSLYTQTVTVETYPYHTIPSLATMIMQLQSSEHNLPTQLPGNGLLKKTLNPYREISPTGINQNACFFSPPQ